MISTHFERLSHHLCSTCFFWAFSKPETKKYTELLLLLNFRVMNAYPVWIWRFIFLPLLFYFARSNKRQYSRWQLKTCNACNTVLGGRKKGGKQLCNLGLSKVKKIKKMMIPVIWKKTPWSWAEPLVHDGVAKGGNVCCSSRVSLVQQRELWSELHRGSDESRLSVVCPNMKEV